MRHNPIIVLAAALVPMTADAAALATQRTLTLEGARKVADAAVAYARTHQAPGAAIAIVDAGGHTLYLERLDGTFAAGADISIGKARTAVAFGRPTRGIEETINKGRVAMLDVAAVTAFTPLQGGVPILASGQIVGAIGVSGAASAQQDEEVAAAGAAAFAASPEPAPQPPTPPGSDQGDAAGVRAPIHVPAADVNHAFQRGVDGSALLGTEELQVNASRRDGPGEAEVHRSDTDVFYILEGSATVVTGGVLQHAREVAPGELRGRAIDGGTSHELATGDVFSVPRGVPHWFSTVRTPFRYYVVKAHAHPGSIDHAQ